VSLAMLKDLAGAALVRSSVTMHRDEYGHRFDEVEVMEFRHPDGRRWKVFPCVSEVDGRALVEMVVQELRPYRRRNIHEEITD